MKLTCPRSGLEYQDSSINSISGTYQSIHPIFNISAKSLLYIVKQIQSEPEPINNYLTGLAIFNLLNPKWESCADRNRALPVITANLERMVSLIYRIPVERRNKFPTFVINKSTADFQSLPTWLDSIESVFSEWKVSSRELSISTQVMRKETVLTRLINSKLHKHRNKIAIILADWAELVAEFPKSKFYLSDDSETTTAIYWKELIKTSFINNHIDLIAAKVDMDDFQDMIDYLEMNLPHGSTHAHILMNRVRKSLSILQEFNAPPKPRIAYEGPKSQLAAMLSDMDIVDNKINNDFTFNPMPEVINPGVEPKPRDFQSNALYIRAKIKWQSQMIKYKAYKNSVNQNLDL